MKVIRNDLRQGWIKDAVEECGPVQLFRRKSYQYSCCGWVTGPAFCVVILRTPRFAAAQIRDGSTAEINGATTPFPPSPTGSETVPSNLIKRNPSGETKPRPSSQGAIDKDASVPVATGST